MKKMFGLVVVVGVIAMARVAGAAPLTITGGGGTITASTSVSVTYGSEAVIDFVLSQGVNPYEGGKITPILTWTVTNLASVGQLTSAGFNSTPGLDVNGAGLLHIVAMQHPATGGWNWHPNYGATPGLTSGYEIYVGSSTGLAPGQSGVFTAYLDQYSPSLAEGYIPPVTIDSSAVLFDMPSEPCSATAPCGNPVPEPASMLLLGSGLLGSGVFRLRRRK